MKGSQRDAYDGPLSSDCEGEGKGLLRWAKEGKGLLGGLGASGSIIAPAIGFADSEVLLLLLRSRLRYPTTLALIAGKENF